MGNVIRWLESKPKLAVNLAVFYAGMIFLLSSMRRVPMPPGPWYTSFILHFVEYLGFGFLLLAALRSRRVQRNPLALAVLIAVAYAASDELHQYFVPGRCPDVWDFIFDSMGSAAGTVINNRFRSR